MVKGGKKSVDCDEEDIMASTENWESESPDADDCYTSSYSQYFATVFINSLKQFALSLPPAHQACSINSLKVENM